MKKKLFLLPLVFMACGNPETKPENTATSLLSWGNDLESTIPLATMDEWLDASGKSLPDNDTMQMEMEELGIDYSNKKIGYKGREKIFNSIIDAVKTSKLKAYKNYPAGELSVNDVKNILVQWDSTTVMEDPNKPGVFFSAPTKMEVFSFDATSIRFHEKIEMDTINFTMNKKINFISLYIYKRTETGETLGQKKLFDVKLND